MKQQLHNPDYKLISVRINNNELVYGEHNNGSNKGLEVYRHKPGEIHHHHSSRYTPGKIPMIYNELYNRLQRMVMFCNPGHKLDLTLDEYKDLSQKSNLTK